MVFSTIFNAGSSETPLLTSVPSVRANRLNAAARKTGPITGSFSLSLSHSLRARGVRKYQRKPPTTPADPSKIQKPVLMQNAADLQQNQRGQRQDGQHFLQHAEQPAASRPSAEPSR